MLIPLLPPEPARVIAGWALRWDETPTINCPRRGRFVERILPGSFADAIAAGKVDLWIDHDRHQGLVASQADGSLRLQEDGVGLWLEADVAHSDPGEEALSLCRGSGYRGASVGMRDVRDVWSTEAGQRIRVIHRADLREVSLCLRGAYQSGRLEAGRMGIDAIRKERRKLRLARAEAAITVERAEVLRCLG